MFKIDNKIPLPPKKTGHYTSKYPWHNMEVGDSFFVPKANVANMRSVASATGRKNNKGFTARNVEGGVRVWRVK